MSKLHRKFLEDRTEYVAHGRMVYRVRRASSIDILREGLPVLEGAAMVDIVEDELDAKLAEQKAGVEDPRISDEQRAEIRAQLAETRRQVTLRNITRALDTPEKIALFLERCDAYLCAMVTGAAMLQKEDNTPGGRLLPSDVDLSTLCEDQRDDKEVAAGRDPYFVVDWLFVRTKEEERPAVGAMWVENLTPNQRVGLGGVLMLLQKGATPSIERFRNRGRSARGPARDGAVLRAAADGSASAAS